jgi:hypothetical protein
VKIVENGTTPAYSGNAVKQFVYSGSRIREERDSNGNLVKHFFKLGQINSGTSYFYELDHLGNIVGLVNSSGVEVTAIRYNAFGNPTVLLGTVMPDFGYAGYTVHKYIEQQWLRSDLSFLSRSQANRT